MREESPYQQGLFWLVDGGLGQGDWMGFSGENHLQLGTFFVSDCLVV